MAPLLPSESAAYTVTLPERLEDDRLNLTIRTGAASTYTKSTVIVHGGLIHGFQLTNITIPEIEFKLEELAEKDWNKLISNEIFYLNVITRKWARLEVESGKERPKPRLYHSIVHHENSLFLFGGLVVDNEENQLIPTNDLWEFNIDNKEWICIDDGSRSGAVNRYDLSLLKTDYVSPEDNNAHSALIIVGGRSDLNQELNHITVFDLNQKKYINNSKMNLNLNEIVRERHDSGVPETGPKGAAQEADIHKLTAVSDKCFIIAGNSSPEGSHNGDDVLLIYSSKHTTEFSNPIVSLPVAPGSPGLRLPLSHSSKHNSSSIPRDLKYPTGGVFGSNILVGGNSPDKNEYQMFSFNRPSQKWTRLSIDSKKRTCEIYLWKSFSWPAHHKVLLLGSSNIPRDMTYPTIQLFDLIVTVGLPITNIYHASTVPQLSTKRLEAKSSSMKETTSFEAYSKYIAPNTKISSIRSVFPNFAVTLGRNAFERYGSSLADFEFISADGEKVNVPIMLLRKRWGRCFDMLLAKAYARAVYKLENQQNEMNPEGSETNSITSGSTGAKKSMMVFNKSSGSREERDVPKFRLPFQEARATPPPSAQQSLAPNSRKASVVSNTSNVSGRTNSTTGDSSLSPNLNFSNLPPPTPPPSEPLPSLDKSPRSSVTPTGSTSGPAFKNGGGFSPFSNSPRGSVSGPSSMTPSAMTPTTSAGAVATSPGGNKLKDEVRTPLQNFKKRDASRSSSFQTNKTDDNGLFNDNQSTIDSINNTDTDDETKLLLEPLLTPRSLYLPFATSTVQALAEFLFTGQLGDKWLFQPTTLDSFLLSKFYEIPLLYDLISEALYAMIGKKEESLIKEYTVFVNEYQSELKKIFKEDEFSINTFFEEHPHVRKSFVEIEGYLNTVDDGYLNVSLLRKASKASTLSDDSSHFKGSITSKRRSSARSRFGKSSLSKEVAVDENEDDIENENEDEVAEDGQPSALGEVSSRRSEKIKFNEDSMSSKSAKKVSSNSDYDDIDPITPLTVHEKTRAHSQMSPTEGSQESVDLDIQDSKSFSQDERERDDADSLPARSFSEDGNIDPLSKTQSQASKPSSGNKTDSENEEIQVPEGRFQLSKAHISKVKSNDSSSDRNDQKQSTSDSDDMGVGLGLLKGTQLTEGHNDGDDNEKKTDFGNAPLDAALPTLENLASPDSPAPTDQLIQVIYEVSALACDMKLLLRAANALEMSTVFSSKREELMNELNTFGLKYEEVRLREELVLREKEERKIQKDEEQAALKRKEVDAKRREELKAQREAERVRGPSRAESSINLAGEAGKSTEGLSEVDDDDSIVSGKSKGGTGIRSAFQSFRSFSSLSLSGLGARKMSPSGSEVEPIGHATPKNQEHSTNPFRPPRGKKDGTSESSSNKHRSIFSAILPKRSHTSKH